MCACDIPVDEKTPNHISSSKLPHVQKYLTSGNCKPWVCACVFSIEKTWHFWISGDAAAKKMSTAELSGWDPRRSVGPVHIDFPGIKMVGA